MLIHAGFVLAVIPGLSLRPVMIWMVMVSRIAASAPDLEIDQDYMRETLYVDFLYVDPSDCYIEEMCQWVRDPKISSIWDEDINLGSADLAIGIPGGRLDLCLLSDHYHFADYAFYEL